MLRDTKVNKYGTDEQTKRPQQLAYSTPTVERKEEAVSSPSSMLGSVFAYAAAFFTPAPTPIDTKPLHIVIPQLEKIALIIKNDKYKFDNIAVKANEEVLIELLKISHKQNYTDLSPDAKIKIISILEPLVQGDFLSTFAKEAMKSYIEAIRKTQGLGKQPSETSGLLRAG